MNDITGFTFFKNYYDSIKGINEEEKKDILLAIVEYVFEDKEPTFDGIKNTVWLLMKPYLSTSKNRSSNAKSKQNQKQIKTKSKTNQTPSYSYSYSYSNIINYLNNKLHSNYKYNTKSTIEKIKARLNEGFKEEDFYKVIDTKVKEWKGTDFEKFLRPETLFGTKFESYLNQKKKETIEERAERLDREEREREQERSN